MNRYRSVKIMGADCTMAARTGLLFWDGKYYCLHYFHGSISIDPWRLIGRRMTINLDLLPVYEGKMCLQSNWGTSQGTCYDIQGYKYNGINYVCKGILSSYLTNLLSQTILVQIRPEKITRSGPQITTTLNNMVYHG